MRRLFGLLLLVLAGCVASLAAIAHEIRPAYLQIDEVTPRTYDVVWRTPLLSGMRLPVALALPEQARDLNEPILITHSDSLIERRRIQIPDGIEGKRIVLVGLEGTITDALVRLSFQDGRQLTEVIRPARPYLDVAPSRGWIDVARVYVVEGIWHILQGFDHLLFIFGLMLLVKDRWMLVKTITAFTLAHSITLAAATYGIVRVPSAPLEAAIAASILFLGVEVVRAQRGELGFAARRPWIVAFAFGLLHGIGFASGLSMIGLPPSAIPLALVSFNVGVEIGQLLFVAVVLASAFALDKLRLPRFALLARAPVYVVGCLGAYWMIERGSTILTG
ncbi:MAG: HupE/UreJ family protein [Alsobacter sp.]